MYIYGERVTVTNPEAAAATAVFVTPEYKRVFI